MQPSPLSEEEFERVKMHPLEGASRLEEVEYLADMAEAVRHHHEYYDGGGYIDHLSGDTIPLTARIIAVADAYDSMCHRRPWRDAKGHDMALAELRENSGRQFDPEVVEAFIAVLEEAAAAKRTEAAPPAAEEPRESAAEPVAGKAKPASRRKSKREEMLRERREKRERMEREALRGLEEGDVGAMPPQQTDAGGEPSGGVVEPGPEEGGGGAAR